jgi:hypothetical protein
MAGYHENTVYWLQREAMVAAVGLAEWNRRVTRAVSGSTITLESEQACVRKMAQLERQVVADWARTQLDWQ